MAKIDPPILPTVKDGRWRSEWTSAVETYYENRGVVTSAPFNQLVDALDQTIKMLNSSYTPEQLREEAERMSLFTLPT
jgi:hypothetical protein